LSGLFGLSGAVNKRDGTDKTNQIDTRATSPTGATLGCKSPMQCLDDWLMAQQYENLVA
jgi:hypothetical protein